MFLAPQPQSSEPSVPIQRQWYDRLVDAILGEEEGSNASKNQYALICQKCFTHNGLVKEEQWMDTREHGHLYLGSLPLSY